MKRLLDQTTCKRGVMNPTRVLIATLFFVGLAVPFIGESQTYQYSGPTSGWFEMLVWDENLMGESHGYGGCSVNLGTMTDSIYLDTVAGTGRQVGTVTVNPTNNTSTFDDSHPDSRGNLVPATLTLNVSLAADVISFDTGVVPLHVFGLGQPFALSDAIQFHPTVDVSYSWTTGGATYTGSFNYQINLFGGNAYRFVSESDSSDSIILSSGGYEVMSNGSAPSLVYLINAANGLNLALTTGGSDKATFFRWYQDSITAQAIPEPNSLMIFSLSSFACILVWRRKGVNKG